MPPSFAETLLLGYARHFPIRKGKLRFVNALWRAASTKGDRIRVTKLKDDPFELRCDLEQMLQRQFYFFGTYFVEEHQLRCWRSAAQGARIVVDVGANAGIYSLAALSSAPGATVHAFEPTPEIADRLRETVARNHLGDRLNVYEMAVSQKDGRAGLVRCKGELGTNEGMNFISSDQGEVNAESVEAVSLDRFCRDNGVDRIDLLKLDIQGHEYMALLGAENLIRTNNIGDIFMELNWVQDGAGPCPATQSVQMLEDAGYQFSEIKPVPRWRAAGDWMRELGDVAASRHPLGRRW